MGILEHAADLSAIIVALELNELPVILTLLKLD